MSLPEQGVLALVHGQPMTELPAELYIPPDALAVYLHAFEGPLDLLSWLIRRNRLDVLDIPMARLTEQYMEYVDWMRRQKFELAADYLVMAVWLIEIKSRMLLPRPALQSENEQDDDPRARLVQRLLDYEMIRLAAARIDALPRLERDYLPARALAELPAAPLPQVAADDVQQAWLGLLSRTGLRARHRAARRELSVRETMGRLLGGLQGELFTELGELVGQTEGSRAARVSQWVVHLLAALELAREGQVEIQQNEPFAPIYLRLVGGVVDVA